MEPNGTNSEGSMDKNAIRKSMVSGFAWQGATKALIQGFSWVATVWVARILDPHDYGIVAVATVFFHVATNVSELGLAAALVQKKGSIEESRDAVFTFGMVTAGVLYALLFLIAPWAADLFSMPELRDVLRVGGIGIFFAAVKAVPYALAMRAMDFRYRSLVELGSQFGQVFAMLVLAMSGFGYWSLVWAFLIGQVLMSVAYWPLFGRWPRLRWFTTESHGVLVFGLKLTVNRMIYVVTTGAPTAIIGKVLGSVKLGYFEMAHQVAIIPLDKIAHVFNQVMFPAISRADENGRDEARSIYLSSHKYLMLIAQPAVVGLALVAPELVKVLLTEKWLPIVPIIQVFCALNLINLSGVTMPPVLAGCGRPGLVVKLTLMGAVMMPFGIIIGVRFDLMGVVIAWALAQPIIFVVTLLTLNNVLAMPMGEYVRTLLPATTGSAVMTAAVLVTRYSVTELSMPAQLSVMIAAGVVAYSVTVLLIFRKDVVALRQMIAQRWA